MLAVLAGCTAGTVIAAVAVGLLLDSGGVTGRRVPAALPGGTVAWANRAAPVYTPPAVPSPAAPAAEFPDCTAADLTGHPGDISAGAGQLTRYVVLTNTGPDACTLSGWPSVLTGLRADGTYRKLGAGRGVVDYGSLIGPANLQRGQSAQVAIYGNDMCPASTSGETDDYRMTAIGIGTSGTVTVTFPHDDPLDMICGGWISTFGVPDPVSDTIVSPLNVLTATAAMPATVTAGTTATYTVTLQNPASHAVKLSPCPSYTQYMAPAGTRPGSNASRYYLNCQAVPEIPAGRSVTFGMQIPVPAAGGAAKYGWALQDAAVQTGGAVSITRPSTGARASASP
jgi:hypothetical protein